MILPCAVFFLLAKRLEKTQKESSSKFANVSYIQQSGFFDCLSHCLLFHLSWVTFVFFSPQWKWTKQLSSVRHHLLLPPAVYGWKPILPSSLAVWRMDEGKYTHSHAHTNSNTQRVNEDKLCHTGEDKGKGLSTRFNKNILLCPLWAPNYCWLFWLLFAAANRRKESNHPLGDCLEKKRRDEWTKLLAGKDSLYQLYQVHCRLQTT